MLPADVTLPPTPNHLAGLAQVWSQSCIDNILVGTKIHLTLDL